MKDGSVDSGQAVAVARGHDGMWERGRIMHHATRTVARGRAHVMRRGVAGPDAARAQDVPGAQAVEGA